ncbi:MAG: hypothetical protein SV422_14075, partial [Pseudomonadota bacterium]|nr:hypothetical protein [Pseudomonadota bacterium]
GAAIAPSRPVRMALFDKNRGYLPFHMFVQKAPPFAWTAARRGISLSPPDKGMQYGRITTITDKGKQL